jgi:hypothetical protein
LGLLLWLLVVLLLLLILLTEVLGMHEHHLLRSVVVVSVILLLVDWFVEEWSLLELSLHSCLVLLELLIRVAFLSDEFFLFIERREMLQHLILGAEYRLKAIEYLNSLLRRGNLSAIGLIGVGDGRLILLQRIINIFLGNIIHIDPLYDEASQPFEGLIPIEEGFGGVEGTHQLGHRLERMRANHCEQQVHRFVGLLALSKYAVQFLVAPWSTRPLPNLHGLMHIIQRCRSHDNEFIIDEGLGVEATQVDGCHGGVGYA